MHLLCIFSLIHIYFSFWLGLVVTNDHFPVVRVDRYDKFCPFYKSVWMMRNIIHFFNLANQEPIFD
ncbi:putative H(+)-transporting two-sector ATPase [Rosa chinensis]|uniref:Putative H(+)-transporting two-sector ATPase n=1 Tax=Rosa chinensis TaxID=74649 RepID=A0A2P6SCL3_ROSCH|nr:putative H(+)-transporting two-sector ATPase [Rosa chinensis]